MEGWRGVVSELALGQLGFVLVNAPQAYGMGFSWYQVPMHTSADATHAGMISDICASRVLVSELLQHLQAEHAIAHEQVMLMGFSQGCCMALETALRESQRLLGVIGISGSMVDFSDMPAALSAHAATLPILQTHGTDDSVIPLSEITRNATPLLRKCS